MVNGLAITDLGPYCLCLTFCSNLPEVRRIQKFLHLWLWRVLQGTSNDSGNEGGERGPRSPRGCGRAIPGHGGPNRILIPGGGLHEA